MFRHVLPLILLVSSQNGVLGQDAAPTWASPWGTESFSAGSGLHLEYDATHRAPLTLADLESIAFGNNPTLAAAAARMDVARGRQVQAGLYPNPVVGYHGVEIGLRDTAGQQGAFIRQRFITGGKLGLDQAIAGKDFDEAHYGFHAQERRVLSDVRVRFYDAQIAQRRVALTQELARIGQELVNATEKLIDARQASENDFLQAEIRADESNILRDNARHQHVEAWRRLTSVIGVATMEVAPLLGELEADLPDYDWEECFALVLDANPVLSMARARVVRARLALLRARKEPIPDIELSVSNRYHNVTRDNVTNVQVGIPIPVFNKNQGNIRSAHAELLAACQEVKRVELDLQDQLAVMYRRYANANHQKDRYRERIVPRAEKSLRLVTDGYKQGQVEYLTLLTAQQTYLQVSLSYLESLRELRTAVSVIEGQLLTGSLQAGR